MTLETSVTDTTPTGMRGPGIFLAQFMSAEAPFDTLANIARWAASQGYKAIQLPTLGTQFIDLARAAEEPRLLRRIESGLRPGRRRNQ